MSPFRTAPVTAECLIVCAALFVVCQLQGLDEVHFRDVQRQWGALVSLSPVPQTAGAHEEIVRQFRGPFDLWSGQWWRIPVSAFHHANFIHLLLNCAAAWTLGRRLEQRWGRFRYFLFLLPAILIPMLLEVLAGNVPVGFSGAICAMLGAQIALQKLGLVDDEDDIPDEALQLSLGLILAGIPASALGLIQIANVAHVSGIVYGWITAWLFCGPWSRSVIARTAFVALHALLIPAVWVAVHPVNNGCHLWYLADRDPHVPPEQRVKLLRLAVETDNSLTGVWLRLAEYQRIEGRLPAAWSLVVEGLSLNPSSAELFEAARLVWRHLPHGPQREAAEAELRRFFGDQAQIWSEQIRGVRIASAKPGKKSSRETPEPAIDPAQFPLDRPIQLDWEPRRPEPTAPPANPDRPDAVEGTVL